MTTNLQKIRQMNSEELAEFFLDGAYANHCDYCIAKNYITCIKQSSNIDGCKDGIIKWLEQEVEE